MNFGQAIAAGFAKYSTFSGRAVRSEYWYWTLFVVAVSIAVQLADFAIGYPFGVFRFIWDFAVLLPSCAVAVRRFHDTDRTGWWFATIVAVAAAVIVVSAILDWLYPAPIATVVCAGVLFVLFSQPGTPGPNRYGPDPFGPDGHLSPPPTA